MRGNRVDDSYLTGTSVMKVTASDADDPTYGSSARVVYSVLEGEKYFTVDSQTGKPNATCLTIRRKAALPGCLCCLSCEYKLRKSYICMSYISFLGTAFQCVINIHIICI